MTNSLEVVEGCFSRNEWSAFLAELPSIALMQTWEYAEAKAVTTPWKPVRAVIRNGDRIVALCQGLSRSLGVLGGGLLWINRGPLISADGPPFCQVVSRIAQWAASRKLYVRIAPPLFEGSLSPEELSAAGFRLTPSTGWCSARVDLRAEEKELRAQLQQKWRNCLNKALRSGLTAEACSSDGAVLRYRSDLEAMLAARPFRTSVTPEFITALQEKLPDDRKMIVISAMHKDKRLGANLFAVYGDTMEYLSGCVGEEGRSLNAGHLLLWSGLMAARARGCRWFDLGGMHPRLTPTGIFHFKEGLNGQRYCLEREVESVRLDWRNTLFRLGIALARRKEASAE